jgi:hypothetical protein
MELTFMPYSKFRLLADTEGFEPIIDGFLNRKEFMLLHAAAKTGKSMLALNIALSISTGRDFLGMETSVGKVLYLQTELTVPALQDRVTAMLNGLPEEVYDLAQINFLISSNRLMLDRAEGIEAVINEVKKELPSLLIIDPLYDMHKKNEDNATDMAPLLSDIREIARTCGCAILLIHHQGKKGEGFSTNAGHACRGSSAFADVPDSSVSLSKDKEGFSLRGIFRNRTPLDNMRLNFDNECLTFSGSIDNPKKKKTREFVLEVIQSSQDGLTKKEIIASLGSSLGIQSSAIQKHLENLRAEGVLAIEGEFKNTRFLMAKAEGRNSSP